MSRFICKVRKITMNASCDALALFHADCLSWPARILSANSRSVVTSPVETNVRCTCASMNESQIDALEVGNIRSDVILFLAAWCFLRQNANYTGLRI